MNEQIEILEFGTVGQQMAERARQQMNGASLQERQRLLDGAMKVITPKQTYRIEFDGGTPCNIPRLGFGDGYGSYRINDEPVHRCNFGRPMSNNVAEMATLAYAVKAIRDRHNGDTAGVTLQIIGDSQIALKWAQGATPSGKKAKFSKGVNEAFRTAVVDLQSALAGFTVTTLWQPRLKSVKTFGH